MKKFTKELYENTILINHFKSHIDALQNLLKDTSSIDNMIDNIGNENAMEQFAEFYDCICELKDGLDNIYNEIEEKHNAKVNSIDFSK